MTAKARISKEKASELFLISTIAKFIKVNATGKIIFKPINNLGLKSFSNSPIITSASDWTSQKTAKHIIDIIESNLLKKENLSILVPSKDPKIVADDYYAPLIIGQANKKISFTDRAAALQENVIKPSKGDLEDIIYENVVKNMTALYKEGIMSKNVAENLVNTFMTNYSPWEIKEEDNSKNQAPKSQFMLQEQHGMN